MKKALLLILGLNIVMSLSAMVEERVPGKRIFRPASSEPRVITGQSHEITHRPMTIQRSTNQSSSEETAGTQETRQPGKRIFAARGPRVIQGQ